MQSAACAVCAEESLPPTLITILSSDVAHLVLASLDRLEDLAATKAALAPRNPQRLHDALVDVAAVALHEAPLYSAVSNFAEDFCWPRSVAAADWHVHPYFAALRAPAFCRVAGWGACSHGLCQKQESAKAGVMELLEDVATSGSSAPAGEVGAVGAAVSALECRARLLGVLGRNEAALRAWGEAAAAGSARAQLDLGIRKYHTGSSASTLYSAPGAQLPEEADEGGVDESRACGSADGAERLLCAAASNPRLHSMGLEGVLVEARACMVLGMMALDGDGSMQCDASAASWFERALRAARRAPKLAQDGAESDSAAANGAVANGATGDVTVANSGADSADAATDGADAAADGADGGCGELKYWGRSRVLGRAQYAERMRRTLRDIEGDARESLMSMEGYTYFRNGRP